MRPLMCVSLILLAGCWTRLLDEIPDLSNSADDAAVAPGPDLKACGSHTLVEVPLTGIDLLDAPFVNHGRAIRVVIDFRLRPACDIPAQPTLTIAGGNAVDSIRVTAHLWKSSLTNAECGDNEGDAQQVITTNDEAGLSSPKVILLDGSKGGTLMGSRAVNPRLGRDCSSIVQHTCALSCDCLPLNNQSVCLSNQMADNGGVCTVPCGEDSDCTDPMSPTCDRGGLPGFTCQSNQPCTSPCPFGQICQNFAGGSGCRPVVTISTPSPQCTCDADCPAGTICPSVTEGPANCFIPCVSASDCPLVVGAPPFFCANGRCGFTG